jgi:hypothetical protein
MSAVLSTTFTGLGVATWTVRDALVAYGWPPERADFAAVLALATPGTVYTYAKDLSFMDTGNGFWTDRKPGQHFVSHGIDQVGGRECVYATHVQTGRRVTLMLDQAHWVRVLGVALELEEQED